MDTKKARFYMLSGGGINALITVDRRLGAGVRVSYTRPDLAVGETAGGFSLASRADGTHLVIVAVGGDFKAPDRTTGTEATWIEGERWQAPDVPPGGYRSAVAYDAAAKAWITVGGNGTDISTDDGRHWRALKPAAGDTLDANKNWNALSLPFVAGPNGRIGKLNPQAFKR
jgi:hypothetical protein